jgi:hypothetical protein
MPWPNYALITRQCGFGRWMGAAHHSVWCRELAWACSRRGAVELGRRRKERGYGSRVVDCRLQIAGCRLQAVGEEVEATQGSRVRANGPQHVSRGTRDGQEVRGTCRGPRIGGAFAGMKRGADFCFAGLEIDKRDEGLWVASGVGWLHTDEERQGFSRKEAALGGGVISGHRPNRGSDNNSQ